MPGYTGIPNQIDFEFADSDSLLVEIEEQYAYVECTDFTLNKKAAEELQEKHVFGSDEYWIAAATMLGSDDVDVQVTGCRVLLCGLQGGTSLEMRNETIDNPQNDVSPEEQAMLDAELIHEIRNCSYQLVKLDYFHKLMRLLLAECKDILKAPMEDDTGHQVLIRLLFSVVYTIAEILRRPPAPSDSEEWRKVHSEFKESLHDSVDYIDDLLMILVDVNSSSLAPVIPMKKAVLLMWKLTLATFGGFNDAHNDKNKKRREAGLPEIENPAVIMKELTPVTTHIDTMVMNMAEGQIDYNGPQHRPKLQRNQKRNTSELEEDFDNLENPEDRPSTPAPTLGRGSRRPSLTSSRPASPTRSESSSLGPSLDSPLATWTYPYLPWQPKVTLSEMDDFVRMARSKYLDYSFKYPKTESQMLAAVNNRYGLPKPIQNSMKIMDKYIYKSLADVQRESWAETEKHQLTKPFKRENSSIEKLYEKIWPNLSMYVISLLKLLLAAAPTANKSDIFMQDQSGPHSIQLEGTQLFKLPVMLISLDVSRHKEIVTKAIVGFILLLMKHLKNNHINQFENLSHHLYGSNCFPLIAKFFNQNMTMFVTQRNQIPKLDLRNAIRGLPVIQALIERATEDQMPFCWRNMFSSICFLRILVKIMKGKPWRVIWLVKYKATNIFKKTLLVKHGVFQLYVLKVIKLHARFLGRQWRKNNMDVVSGIYGMVRHHLTDDWAFFNAEPDKESSVQEENKITQTCSYFNRIVYLPEYQEWTKTGHIAKFNEIRVPPNFGSQYKAWVDKEVMSVNVDWDQLLTSENGDSVYQHEENQVNEPAAA